jgi:hypothetical protein
VWLVSAANALDTRSAAPNVRAGKLLFALDLRLSRA